MGYTKGRVPLEKSREISKIRVGLDRYVGAYSWAVDEEEDCWLTGAATYHHMGDDGEMFQSREWCFHWKEVEFLFFGKKIYNTEKLDHTLKLTYEIALETSRMAYVRKATRVENDAIYKERRKIYDENLEEIKKQLVEAFKVYGDDGDERDQTLPENVTVLFVAVKHRD